MCMFGLFRQVGPDEIPFLCLPPPPSSPQPQPQPQPPQLTLRFFDPFWVLLPRVPLPPQLQAPIGILEAIEVFRQQALPIAVTWPFPLPVPAPLPATAPPPPPVPLPPPVVPEPEPRRSLRDPRIRKRFADNKKPDWKVLPKRKRCDCYNLYLYF